MNPRNLTTGSGFRPGPPEFLASLGLLAAFMVLVVVALIGDGDRTKALRIGLAAGTYLLILAAAGIAAGRAAARKAGAAARSGPGYGIEMDPLLTCAGAPTLYIRGGDTRL